MRVDRRGRASPWARGTARGHSTRRSTRAQHEQSTRAGAAANQKRRVGSSVLADGLEHLNAARPGSGWLRTRLRPVHNYRNALSLTHTHTHTHTRAHTPTHTCTHTHTQHIHTHTDTNKHIHTYTYAFMHSRSSRGIASKCAHTHTDLRPVLALHAHADQEIGRT